MKFRNWLTRVMSGRYGNDQLNRFLYFFTIAMLLLSMFIRGSAVGSLLWILGVFSLGFSTFRTFSRNMGKRRAENAVYLRLSGKLSGGVKGSLSRYKQRRDYKFFRCPSCKAWLRVPKGKGKVNITCRQCGERFTGNT